MGLASIRDRPDLNSHDVLREMRQGHGCCLLILQRCHHRILITGAMVKTQSDLMFLVSFYAIGS